MQNQQVIILVLFILLFVGIAVFFIVKNNSDSGSEPNTGGMLQTSPSEQRVKNISSGGSTKYPIPVMNKVFDGCKDHHGKKINWEKSQKVLRRDKGQLNNDYFSPRESFPSPCSLPKCSNKIIINDYKCPAPNGKMVSGEGNKSTITGHWNPRDEMHEFEYHTDGFNYMKCKDRKVKLGLSAENPEEKDLDKMKFHWYYMCSDGEI